MSKKTPKGQTSTGNPREDSRNPGSKGTAPEPIEKLEYGDEKSGPTARPRSASSGAESMSDLDAERVEFEEPTRTDTVRNRPMDEE